MQRLEHLRQMASYNTWMNARLYEAAQTLPDTEISVERGPSSVRSWVRSTTWQWPT